MDTRLVDKINQILEENTKNAANLVTDYVINVKTSDRFGAGTDADVFVRLLGDRDADGRLEPLALKNSQNLNKFERNSFDQFTFCDQISRGKLEKIKIWHDDTGLGASWHLEFVEVCDIGAQVKYRFPCHRWLSSTKDDEQICRTLRCTEVSVGPKQTVQVATGTPKAVLSINNRFKKVSLTSFISRPSSSQNAKRTDSAPSLSSPSMFQQSGAASSSSNEKIAVSLSHRLNDKISYQNFSDDLSSTNLNCGNDDDQEQSDMVAKLRESGVNRPPGAGARVGKFSLIEPSSNKIEVFSARPSTVYGRFSFGRGSGGQESSATATLGQKQSSKSSLYGPFSSR